MNQMDREQTHREQAMDRLASRLRSTELNQNHKNYLGMAIEKFVDVIQTEHAAMLADPAGWTTNGHGRALLRPVLAHVAGEALEHTYNMLAVTMREAVARKDENMYQATLDSKIGEAVRNLISVQMTREATDPAEYRRAFKMKLEGKDVWTTKNINSFLSKLGTELVDWSDREVLMVGDYFSRLMLDNLDGKVNDDGTKNFPLFTRRGGRDGMNLGLHPDAEDVISTQEMCDLVTAFSRRAMIEVPAKFSDCPDLTWGGWFTHPIPAVPKSSFGDHHTGKRDNQAVSVDIAKFLDRVAGTAYVVNQDVLNVASWIFTVKGLMWKKGDGGFTEFIKHPMPTKPKGVDQSWFKTPEGIAYIQAREEAQNLNRAARSKKMSIANAVHLADVDRHEPSLYFPASLDFRGRIYFRTQDLSPQGDTFNKGVLQFRDAKPINLDVMRRFIASFVTDSGDLSDVDMSKKSEADQIQWTKDNLDVLNRIANNPADTVDLWSRTDSPFEFLGAVIDYTTAMHLDDPTAHMSRVICRVDAVCSGVQHLGTIARDSGVADAVCLRGQERTTDLYTLMSEAVNQEFIKYRDNPEAWATRCDIKGVADDRAPREYEASVWSTIIMDLGGHGRSDLKPACMQFSYAVKERTIGMRLLDDRDWRKKLTPHVARHLGLDVREALVMNTVSRMGQFMSQVQFDCIDKIAFNLRGVMSWYQECVSILADHEQGWEYTNPVGFTMRQFYSKKLSVTIPTPNYSVRIQTTNGDINKTKQVSGISANQTHSLDGALLVLTHATFSGTMSVIHDSVGCHSSDMEELQTSLRKSHVLLYQGNRLAEMKQQNEDRTGLTLPEPPEMGDLELSDVLTASYYFS